MPRRGHERRALLNVGSTGPSRARSQSADREARLRRAAGEAAFETVSDQSDQQEPLAIAVELIAVLGESDAVAWADNYMLVCVRNGSDPACNDGGMSCLLSTSWPAPTCIRDLSQIPVCPGSMLCGVDIFPAVMLCCGTVSARKHRRISGRGFRDAQSRRETGAGAEHSTAIGRSSGRT